MGTLSDYLQEELVSSYKKLVIEDAHNVSEFSPAERRDIAQFLNALRAEDKIKIIFAATEDEYYSSSWLPLVLEWFDLPYDSLVLDYRSLAKNLISNEYDHHLRVVFDYYKHDPSFIVEVVDLLINTSRRNGYEEFVNKIEEADMMKHVCEGSIFKLFALGVDYHWDWNISGLKNLSGFKHIDLSEEKNKDMILDVVLSVPPKLLLSQQEEVEYYAQFKNKKDLFGRLNNVFLKDLLSDRKQLKIADLESVYELFDRFGIADKAMKNNGYIKRFLETEASEDESTSFLEYISLRKKIPSSDTQSKRLKV